MPSSWQKNKWVPKRVSVVPEFWGIRTPTIIVAGGDDEAGAPLTLIEVLDPGATEWRPGLDLPLGIKYSRMIEEQDGGGCSGRRWCCRWNPWHPLPPSGCQFQLDGDGAKVAGPTSDHLAFLVEDDLCLPVDDATTTSTVITWATAVITTHHKRIRIQLIVASLTFVANGLCNAGPFAVRWTYVKISCGAWAK